MTVAERRLLELLAKRSFRDGEFRLASGDTSSYYIDGKMTEVSPEGAYLIGEVIRERTQDVGRHGDQAVDGQLRMLGQEVVRVAGRFAVDDSLHRAAECQLAAERVAAA